MEGYQQTSLKDLLNYYTEKDEFSGGDRVKSILSEFYCPKNPDVEKFLKQSALEMAKQNITTTYLVTASYRNENVLIGYFSLTNKVLTLKDSYNISESLRRKLKKYGTRNELNRCYDIAAPLIAQLGKNYNNNYNKLITGDELLKLACDKVAIVQELIGGKLVYLECEDKPKLVTFYETNGFKNLGKRTLDRDEKDDLYGDYLLQMAKIT